MTEPENVITRRSQHPVIRGMVCGALFVVVTTFLIGFVPPAYAFSLPVGNLFVIDLGDLPPWIGVAVAFGVWWDARKAKKNAADAAAAAVQAATTSAQAATDAALGRTEIKAVAVQIDGLLADRDKAKVKEGKQEEKIAGEERAETLAKGQQEGREIERASVAANPSGGIAAVPDAEVPTKDKRVAAATERSADAQERVAKAAEEKKKD